MMNRIKRAIREWLGVEPVVDDIARDEVGQLGSEFDRRIEVLEDDLAERKEFLRSLEDSGALGVGPPLNLGCRAHPSTLQPVPGKLFMRMRPGS
ncbi:MAG: hypothetical protein AAGG56_18845 [Pseudomonadota bacterium]